MNNINKYMQKAGEPENDAGFLKHIQLNCSYSYTSKPSLVVTVFRMHIYGFSKCLFAHTATARVNSHVHSTCTSYVLYAYIFILRICASRRGN